jgi:cytochrome d ubiquinol oxidase subunit II
MNLQLPWFILVIFLFTGLFVLEGFDYGVGMLYPWLTRNDTDRRILLNTIGPFWLGNEVWMVCGIGALFAAFPAWYAALFSSLYPILLLILAFLVIRGAAIEFRNHYIAQTWRNCWDIIVAASSLLVSFCWGIVLANVVGGLRLDQQAHYVGNFFDLLTPYALLWGLVLTAFFILYGSLFLLLRLEKRFTSLIQNFALKIWIAVLGLLLVLAIMSTIFASVALHLTSNPEGVLFALLALGVFVLSGWQLRRSNYRLAFAFGSLTIIVTAIALGISMYPHVLISSLHTEWSLTLAQTASAPYTLQIISWIIIPLLPFLILSQIGSYWIFRHRSALYY